MAQVLRGAGGELAYSEAAASGELCELAKQGRLDYMKVLLSSGCGVNAADYDKRTALHLAASEGNSHIVKALLEAGANVFALDRWGSRPVIDAVREGHHQVAKLLSDHMDKLGGDDNGFTHLAAVRSWLLDVGVTEGAGLGGVLAILDIEGVDNVDLLAAAWPKLEPMLRVGPAARVKAALKSG